MQGSNRLGASHIGALLKARSRFTNDGKDLGSGRVTSRTGLRNSAHGRPPMQPRSAKLGEATPPTPVAVRLYTLPMSCNGSHHRAARRRLPNGGALSPSTPRDSPPKVRSFGARRPRAYTAMDKTAPAAEVRCANAGGVLLRHKMKRCCGRRLGLVDWVGGCAAPRRNQPSVMKEVHPRSLGCGTDAQRQNDCIGCRVADCGRRRPSAPTAR